MQVARVRRAPSASRRARAVRGIAIRGAGGSVCSSIILEERAQRASVEMTDIERAHMPPPFRFLIKIIQATFLDVSTVHGFTLPIRSTTVNTGRVFASSRQYLTSSAHNPRSIGHQSPNNPRDDILDTHGGYFVCVHAMMSARGSLRREAQLKCELDQTQDETGTVRPPDEDILGGEQPVHGPHEAVGDLGDGERRKNGSRIL